MRKSVLRCCQPRSASCGSDSPVAREVYAKLAACAQPQTSPSTTRIAYARNTLTLFSLKNCLFPFGEPARSAAVATTCSSPNFQPPKSRLALTQQPESTQERQVCATSEWMPTGRKTNGPRLRPQGQYFPHIRRYRECLNEQASRLNVYLGAARRCQEDIVAETVNHQRWSFPQVLCREKAR